MADLKWCKKQPRGIKLIDPNDNLCDEYMQTAEETLEVLKCLEGKSKVWLATTKYYCEYFAVYSLMMKIGIKCEIHDCTVAVCKMLEDMDIVPIGYTEILEVDKGLRIDNQYYLKNRDVPMNYDMMVNFVMTIKNISIRLTSTKITEVRNEINTIP